MNVRVLGKVWKFIRVPLKKADGYCDAPHVKGKRIRIDSSLKGLPELDTIIHELLHAAFWVLGEPAVENSATDIARHLWDKGWTTLAKDGTQDELASLLMYKLRKAYKYIDDEFIHHTAHDVARVLWRLGYRR